MKKLFKYITIAFLLVVGATFAEQINSALDWLQAVDYTALGNTIGTLASKIADGAVDLYNWVVGLFIEVPVMETMEPVTGSEVPVVQG